MARFLGALVGRFSQLEKEKAGSNEGSYGRILGKVMLVVCWLAEETIVFVALMVLE